MCRLVVTPPTINVRLTFINGQFDVGEVAIVLAAARDGYRTRVTSGYLVLANAGAGSTEQAAVGLAVARLAEHAPTRLCWTESTDDFRAAIEETGAEEQVVVAGGDGSIHLALCTFDELGRREETVGIVPLGTGNDFARNHQLPLDPVEAAECIVAGGVRTLDVIELSPAGEQPVLVANNLHVGLGVASARRAQSLKPTLGRFAYPAATAYEGVTGSAEPVVVRAGDDLLWDGPALAVLVLLGPSMGGGVPVVDDRVDGIDLVVIGEADLRERVDLVFAVRNGELDGTPGVLRRTVESVTIDVPESADRSSIDADVDGELMELAAPLGIRLRRRGWRVLLPVGDRLRV